jgi:hypothetical protein
MVSLSTAFATKGKQPQQPGQRKRKPVSLRAAFASPVTSGDMSTEDRDRQKLGQFMRLFGDATGAKMFLRRLTLDQAFAEHDAAVIEQQRQAFIAGRRAAGG